MGLLSFMKEAGEKLFGGGEAKAAQAKVAAAPTPENVAAMSAAAGKAIADYVGTQGLKVEGLDVGFDAPSATVTVAGTVPDQATREKVLLCCGNVSGVSAARAPCTCDTARKKSDAGPLPTASDNCPA